MAQVRKQLRSRRLVYCVLHIERHVASHGGPTALLFLISLVRFPGFIWLIAVGFLLPSAQRPYGNEAFPQ
jgi:hypothetical protein